MTTKRFAAILMALFVALLLGALPASAEHRRHASRDAKIEKIAYKLKQATNELYSEAVDSRRHHRGRKQHQALRSLARLDHRAGEFFAQVRGDAAIHRGTLREFRRLEQAYEDARQSISHRRTGKALHRDFDRVGQLMGRLDTKIARVDLREERNYDRRYGWRQDRDQRYGSWHDREHRWSFAWTF